MEIVTFDALHSGKIDQLYRYILAVRKDPFFFSTMAEMVRNYRSLVFNEGRNFFIALHNDEICGTIGMITKDVHERGEIFLTAINFQPDHVATFSALLEQVLLRSADLPWQSYKLGLMPEQSYLIGQAEEAGFGKPYHNLRLNLVRPELLKELETPKELTFQNLTRANMQDFIEVHNAAFRITPNGAILKPEEMDELIEKAATSPMFEQIGYAGAEPVLVISLEIRNGVGWIDGLGVHPAFHGRGFGKLGLKQAVETLQMAGTVEISLTVMEMNTNAYQMYLKYGFEHKTVQSIWLEKSK